MADKKSIQLNPAGALTINDIIMITQNLVTGELLQTDLGDLRSFILGGSTAGARIYFTSDVPDDDLGVDGDVTFDKVNKNIYSKISGSWVLQDSYGAADGGTGLIRFTSVYGSDGLSLDGLTYTNADLIGGDVMDVRVETVPLIRVTDIGDTPGADEFDFDTNTGVITFGAAVPAGFRIGVTYSF